MGFNSFTSLPTAWTFVGSGSRRLLASASYPLVDLRIPFNSLTVGWGGQRQRQMDRQDRHRRMYGRTGRLVLRHMTGGRHRSAFTLLWWHWVWLVPRSPVLGLSGRPLTQSCLPLATRHQALRPGAAALLATHLQTLDPKVDTLKSPAPSWSHETPLIS
jgi:hypothetical protein